MAAQLYYEDVEVGSELPLLEKNPSTRQLVQWAGASGDFYEIHYDQVFARSTGLEDIIVHGKLKSAFLSQLVTDWIGERGIVRKFSVRYREMDYPRQRMVCRGRVTRKTRQDGDCLVECELWTENPKGQQTTTGTAVVSLPART